MKIKGEENVSVLQKPDIIKTLFQSKEFNLPDTVFYRKEQPEQYKMAYGIKKIRKNDFFISRHGGFYPLTITAELLAQGAQIAAVKLIEGLAEKEPRFYSCPATMRKLIEPGNILFVHVKLEKRRSNIFLLNGKVYLMNSPVALYEGDIYYEKGKASDSIILEVENARIMSNY
jgi:3-hydroxymyristoyl/3-hydroxydecanoyl-(acyl carrier protein) dehydratase